MAQASGIAQVASNVTPLDDMIKHMHQLSSRTNKQQCMLLIPQTARQ